jgi:NAD(P)-dependent dehydrogenase (short-subunit alcohol dehydrogenase family)
MTGIAPIDLTDPEQARKMVEDAAAAYGRLDVVFNNAAPCGLPDAVSD